MPCYSEYKEYMKEELANKFGGEFPLEIIPNLKSIIDEPIAAIPERLGEYFGILSLTKSNNNGLMWAHYADSHKGFAIGFDSESPFFKSGKSNEGLREVKYSSQRAIVPYGGLKSLDSDGLAKANEYFFFTKSENWRYEEELRILASLKKADSIPCKVEGYDLCLFNFPKECVKEVILGYRMPEDTRQEIAKILERKYPRTVLYQALLNETQFDLDIVPYKN
jgi:hypothetical protein